MRFTPLDPPRVFKVDQPDGISEPLLLKDCGRVELEPDEQITFITEAGAEYDIARKSWGYYATPSLNSRLLRFGLHAVLVRDEKSKFVILLVEEGKEAEFKSYIELEEYTIVCWLDSTQALEAIERRLIATQDAAKGINS